MTIYYELLEIELFLTFKICTNVELNCLKYKCFMYKIDLALKNLQRLMCHKPNQTIYMLPNPVS